MPQIVTFDKFYECIDVDGFVAIILMEHLGDIIACEPVIRYAKKTWPGKPIAWVLFKKYADILQGHPELDYIVEAPSLLETTKWAQTIPKPSIVVNLHFSGRPCFTTGQVVENDNRRDINEYNYFDYGPLLASFALIAGLPVLDDAPRHYLVSEQYRLDLPKRYVVFHCRSNEYLKDWSTENWLKLLDYFSTKGIHVLEIGMESEISVANPFYHDMTRIRSFDQIAKIIKGSEFFFGIDSAFAHMANALEKEGLIILGKYKHWERYCPYTGLYRNGHTIGYRRLPARYIEAEKVIARYEKVIQEGFDNTPEEPARAAPDPFPNALQRVLLKLYRPVVKYFSSSFDYALFKRDAGAFFIIPGRPAPLVGLMRGILHWLGPVPPKLNAMDEF